MSRVRELVWCGDDYAALATGLLATPRPTGPWTCSIGSGRTRAKILIFAASFVCHCILLGLSAPPRFNGCTRLLPDLSQCHNPAKQRMSLVGITECSNPPWPASTKTSNRGFSGFGKKGCEPWRTEVSGAVLFGGQGSTSRYAALCNLPVRKGRAVG